MRIAENILDEHCTTVYNRYSGDEEIDSSKSAVIIAMEEYAEEKCDELESETINSQKKLLEYVRSRLQNNGTIYRSNMSDDLIDSVIRSFNNFNEKE